MRFKTKFQETDHKVDVNFNEKYNINDNLYQEGHEKGYQQGKTDGHDEGYQEGHQQGYADGFQEGEKVSYNSGYQDGQKDGYSSGYDHGLAEGEETGKEIGKMMGYEQAKTDHWDMRQENGNRKQYSYFFAGSATTQEYVDSMKYPITFPEEASVNTRNNQLMFAAIGWGVTGFQAIDLSKVCGMIDFSKCKSANNVFANAKVIKITADFSNCENLTQTFSNADNGTRTIDYINIKVSAKTVFSKTFDYCSTLTELRFIEGSVIGQNGLDLQRSTLLSHDSLINTLHTLEDKSKDTSGTAWVVTIGSTNRAKLTDEEIEIATKKGWTLK